jgi:hypothetical protein
MWMLLAFSVAEPVEAHVDSFSVFRLDLAIDDAFGSGVVGLKGHGWLFMTKFFKDYVNEDGFVHHDVKGRDFGFSSGSHDMVDDMSNVENGAIIGQYVSIGGEERVASSVAACFGFAQVAGITVDSKDHVAGIISENRIFLSSEVIKKLHSLFQGCLGGMSGLGYYGADGTQESGVNSAAKEKKFTTDFLDELLALGIKRRGFGRFSGVLFLGAIFNRGAGEW